MDATLVGIISTAGASVGGIAAVATFAYWRGKDMGKKEEAQANGVDIARLQEHQIDQDRRLEEGSEKFSKLLTGQQSIKSEIILLRRDFNGHLESEKKRVEGG